MSPIAIAGSLVAMAKRRSEDSDELIIEAREAHRAARATNDPDAEAALHRAGHLLYGAAVMLRLHGWTEPQFADLLTRATDRSGE